jgi:hypothetical protein
MVSRMLVARPSRAFSCGMEVSAQRYPVAREPLTCWAIAGDRLSGNNRSANRSGISLLSFPFAKQRECYRPQQDGSADHGKTSWAHACPCFGRCRVGRYRQEICGIAQDALAGEARIQQVFAERAVLGRLEDLDRLMEHVTCHQSFKSARATTTTT